MNIEMSWNVNTYGLLYIGNSLSSNEYSINVRVITNTESTHEQLIAYSRQKFFLTAILENSIFLDYSIENHHFLTDNLDQNFVYLPGPCSDFNICVALFHKLTAISDNKLIVDQIELASSVGDNIFYTFDSSMIVPLFNSASWCTAPGIKPWWHRNDTSTRDDFSIDGEFFEPDLTWDELDLAYALEAETPISKAKRKNSSFTIITGGKDDDKQ